MHKGKIKYTSNWIGALLNFWSLQVLIKNLYFDFVSFFEKHKENIEFSLENVHIFNENAYNWNKLE